MMAIGEADAQGAEGLLGLFDAAVHDPAPATSPAGLAELLASPEPAPLKCAALTRALRERQPALARTVRERLARERDPVMISALASALATCGSCRDAEALGALLHHADSRVTASAVEALFRLKVPVTVDLVARVLDQAGDNAIATVRGLLDTLPAAAALEVLSELVTSGTVARRTAVATLLGELSARPGSTELVLTRLAAESDPAVLSALARALADHAGLDRIRALIGPLRALSEAADGPRSTILAAALEVVIARSGLAPEAIAAIGEQYLKHHPVPREVRSTRKSRFLKPSPEGADLPPDRVIEIYELSGESRTVRDSARTPLGLALTAALALALVFGIASGQLRPDARRAAAPVHRGALTW